MLLNNLGQILYRLKKIHFCQKKFRNSTNPDAQKDSGEFVFQDARKILHSLRIARLPRKIMRVGFFISAPKKIGHCGKILMLNFIEHFGNLYCAFIVHLIRLQKVFICTQTFGQSRKIPTF